MTSPPDNFFKENVIKNPLNLTQLKQSERPSWLCNHADAKIVSYDPRKFTCSKCDKCRVIKIVSQRDILNAITTNK